MSTELPKAYEPHETEARLYAGWERDGVFAPRGEGEAFCIVLPPPNVTGILHMGHALDHSIQDAIVRRKRMQGMNVLWLPGTDHAGIATQNVVEREIAKRDGSTRHDLGRDAFVARVWEWKASSGGTITAQMRRLGDSVDWSRERFTMDEDLSRAVREVFVRLFEAGLIYRGNRITNWCPRCMTAISDIEVEHSDTEGELVEIHYELADGSGRVTVATTRVETMLGDTGIAVHPDDERYAGLIGRTVRHPFRDDEIPLVADGAVDRSFGTGAVKVTPAHDPTDFEIAQRAGLPEINIFTPEAKVSGFGPFDGLDRHAARKAVTEALRERGLIGSEERPYLHAVGHCSRCHTEVEPWLSEQWFVKVEPLARPAIEAVRDGRTRFVPVRYERNYLDWMENLRDWCISRQLWWGHRIPVWTCEQGHAHAYREDPAACTTCGSAALEQDPDVLDTWFSSALWPFSTLGWPDDTADLRTWYPTSVLVTGYDIITFWVSRMMMMGLRFMDRVPFADVSIHGMVRDFRGKKMSKSFGNAMDPIELIDRYGADALRLTLLRSATLGADVPLDEKWIEGDRNFCNKLWNISRFVMMNLDGPPGELPPPERRTLADRWILSRLDAVTREADEAAEAYDFARMAQTLRQFTWTEFADWHVEWSKGRLYEGTEREKADQRAVLAYALERLLRLLHPITPFITEEIWRSLTGGTTIVTAPWPGPTGERDEGAEREMDFLQRVIGALRRFKADHDIARSTKPAATAAVPDDGLRALLERELERVRALGTWGALDVTAAASERGAEARLVLPEAAVHVPLEGLLDLDAERERLARERRAHEAEAARIEGKLVDRSFTERAPEAVVEQHRERLATEQDLISRLDQALADLG